jgi:5-formyltetrahydrofolate cyclo-ligase
MTKPELRTLYLAKRLLIPEEEFQQKSESITNQLLEIILDRKPRKVLLFLPIEQKREFDCRPLAKKLWSLGVENLIPSANFQTKEMQFSVFDPDTKLEQNKYGILEPKNPTFIIELSDSLTVVPLLIQDKNNFRVGYGGGFYDRFLAKNKETYSVGVSFFEALSFNIDFEVQDIALNQVVLSK